MSRFRLGLPVKFMGAPLRSHDSRRRQNNPHLSVSLAYLRDILAHLDQQEIRLYRMAGQFAPYLTHPDFPQFHRQIDECSTDLAATGDLARAYGIRLTMHPGHYVQLGAPDGARVERSQHELACGAALMDAMGLDANSVMVIHIGGRYREKEETLARFVGAVLAMPPAVQQRLALENDDRIFDLADVLWVHRRTGMRIVLDVLHHRCHGRDGRSLGEALDAALTTWPADQRPKIHLSSARTAFRTVRQNGLSVFRPPLPNQHSDFIDPFAAIELLRTARDAAMRPFDIMLEAKAKDLALLRLREQITRFAPDLAGMVR